MKAGLTGGIGSGKSMVARAFEALGAKVFNSDAAAKKIYFREDVRRDVRALLGDEAYLNERELNRRHISGKIFSDKDLLVKLNALIHPKVKEAFELFCEENKSSIIIKETALLFEAGIDKEVDKIILVTAQQETRVNRVMKRDGLSREMVLLKMKAQISEEEKIKRAHFVIQNEDHENILPAILTIYQTLQQHA